MIHYEAARSVVEEEQFLSEALRHCAPRHPAPSIHLSNWISAQRMARRRADRSYHPRGVDGKCGVGGAARSSYLDIFTLLLSFSLVLVLLLLLVYLFVHWSPLIFG